MPPLKVKTTRSWEACRPTETAVRCPARDGAAVRVVAGQAAAGVGGADGAGAVAWPDGAVAPGLAGRLLGVEGAPGGVAAPHPAARPAATASTARPRSDRTVITPFGRAPLPAFGLCGN